MPQDTSHLNELATSISNISHFSLANFPNSKLADIIRHPSNSRGEFAKLHDATLTLRSLTSRTLGA